MKNTTETTRTRDPARVVVGVDGSRASIGALRRGARVAAALDVHLEAVTAWHHPEVSSDHPGQRSSPGGSDLADGAQAMLDATVSAVFAGDPPSWFHGTVREGGTAQTLIDESRGAEMLIVGSRGHGGVDGLLLGSVSEACAEHATCPVLIFHDTGRRTAEA